LAVNETTYNSEGDFIMSRYIISFRSGRVNTYYWTSTSLLQLMLLMGTGEVGAIEQDLIRFSEVVSIEKGK